MALEGSVVSTICTKRCKSSSGHRKGVRVVCSDQGKGWNAACGAELGKADETIYAKVALAFIQVGLLGWLASP